MFLAVGWFHREHRDVLPVIRILFISWSHQLRIKCVPGSHQLRTSFGKKRIKCEVDAQQSRAWLLVVQEMNGTWLDLGFMQGCQFVCWVDLSWLNILSES